MAKADDAFDDARRRIAAAKAEGAERLDLRIKGLERIPEEIAGLTRLRQLDLMGTGVRDLGPLAGLTGLTGLDLRGALVKDLGPLAGLTRLTRLSLTGTGVSDLGPLAGLTGLTQLYHAGTGVSDLGPLAGLTGLTQLDLSGTGVSDLGPLAGLTGLTQLYLSGTGVSDLGPLAGLTGLTQLYLSGTGVSDLGPLAGLTGLTVLDLGGTGVSDLGPLAGLTGLTVLDLGGTGVSDLGPLAGLTGLTVLDLGGTGVSDLGPLAGLAGLTRLDLAGTGVSDLGPLAGLTGLTGLFLRGTGVERDGLLALAGLTWLITEPGPEGTFDEFKGLTFKDCAAAKTDARIAEIAGIKDASERARALFEYLGMAVPGEGSGKGIEAQLKGPVLAKSIADVRKGDERFEATALEDGPDRDEDQRYRDLLETLTFSARMSGTEVANRIGREVVGSFADYAKFAERRPVNARLLNYLAAGLRAAIADEDTRVALDAFDLSKVVAFLEEHDTLVRDYHATALEGPQFEVATDPETLVRELFPKLGAAREILKQADADGLFAPSVSDALEMLNRRAEGARKRLLTSGDPQEREQAVADLRRNAVLVTAYLGRIKGRLLQWTRKQVDHAKENPLQTSVNLWAMTEVAKGVIATLTPVFEALWRLIGNLPLPF